MNNGLEQDQMIPVCSDVSHHSSRRTHRIASSGDELFLIYEVENHNADTCLLLRLLSACVLLLLNCA